MTNTSIDTTEIDITDSSVELSTQQHQYIQRGIAKGLADMEAGNCLSEPDEIDQALEQLIAQRRHLHEKKPTMNISQVTFTNNALIDLADIRLFQTVRQKIPQAIADNTIAAIRKKTTFLLANLPYGGKLFGHMDGRQVRTFVVLKKYMVFYCFDKSKNLVAVLHVFCTLMDDRQLFKQLASEGIIKQSRR